MKHSILQKFVNLNKNIQDKIEAIYLFGSRARGDEKPDSDYDLLVIVKKNFLQSDKDTLYDHVMDILLETGHVLSLKIFKKNDFNRLRQLHTPFTENIMRERVKVG